MHHCIGAGLARMKLQVAFSALAFPTLRVAVPYEEALDLVAPALELPVAAATGTTAPNSSHRSTPSRRSAANVAGLANADGLMHLADITPPGRTSTSSPSAAPRAVC